MLKDRLTLFFAGNLYLKNDSGAFERLNGKERYFDVYLKLAMYENMEEMFKKNKEKVMKYIKENDR